MTESCDFSQVQGTQQVCGLLGNCKSSETESQGIVLALCEIVTTFQIGWSITSLGGSQPVEEGGSLIEIRGSHEAVAHRTDQTCRRCANLMLALALVGNWLVPRDGSCGFCAAEAFSGFIHGDRENQGERCSTRTLRIISGPGTPCQLATCDESCLREIRRRLTMIGAVERKRKPTSMGGTHE
jgi:hypothetical protein